MRNTAPISGKIASNAHPFIQPIDDLMSLATPRPKFRWPMTSATCISTIAPIQIQTSGETGRG